MSARLENENLGVEHGRWGESVAVNYLRRNGFEIIDRNVRPHEKDRRLEIDIVAFDRTSDTMVFVEVKQHATLSGCSRRLRSVNRRKRINLRRACDAWRRTQKWRGAFRFDVVEVYGVPEGGTAIIDHIPKVNLFARNERFVKWD